MGRELMKDTTTLVGGAHAGFRHAQAKAQGWKEKKASRALSLSPWLEKESDVDEKNPFFLRHSEK